MYSLPVCSALPGFLKVWHYAFSWARQAAGIRASTACLIDVHAHIYVGGGHTCLNMHKSYYVVVGVALVDAIVVDGSPLISLMRYSLLVRTILSSKVDFRHQLRDDCNAMTLMFGPPLLC